MMSDSYFQGLTSIEANKIRDKVGANILPETSPPRLLPIFVGQFNFVKLVVWFTPSFDAHSIIMA